MDRELIIFSIPMKRAMKKFLFLAIAIMGFAFTGNSQAQKKIETITISTPTVQCEMCKDRIENYLKRETGIQKVTVDYRNKKTKVTYYTDRTNPNYIRTAIANLGYDADDETKNEESYKKLPECCKKPEDRK
jgi:mercuric ion binding protein